MGIEEYGNYSKEDIEAILKEMIYPQSDTKWSAWASKSGYIQLVKDTLECSDVSEKEIIATIKKLEKELPEGMYKFEV